MRREVALVVVVVLQGDEGDVRVGRRSVILRVTHTHLKLNSNEREEIRCAYGKPDAANVRCLSTHKVWAQ